MLTRAERRERNKQAHVIRRLLTDADYARAKGAATGATWREFADLYAGMSTDDVLATWQVVDGRAVELDARPPATVSAIGPRVRREAPAHVRAAREAYRWERQAWEDRFEAETGRTWAPGLVERMRRLEESAGVNEVTQFVEAHPAPVFKDFLRATRGPECNIDSEVVGA